MELRVLEYFLAITREQSISAAAEALHLSQPTLSRQIKDMEEELGKQLIIRGNRKITLTEEGMLLRKRAEEIISLVRKTEDEIILSNEDELKGEITIGTGESDSIRLIATLVKSLQEEHPAVQFHIISGDSTTVMEQLDHGIIDFGIVFEPCDLTKYDYVKLPVKDVWGVLMRNDSELSQKTEISKQDLNGLPLILSRQQNTNSEIYKWLASAQSKPNIVATYNLLNNATLLVNEGIGYAICLDKLINVTGDSNLCFKPLFPKQEIGIFIIWKKYQVFSKVAEEFSLKIMDSFK